MPGPQFITFKPKYTEITIRNTNQFYIQIVLDSIAGKMNNATQQKNGILFAEIHNRTQS
jgi:hypothetical protein